MSTEHGKENVSEIFKTYISAMFPYLRHDQVDKDAEIKEAVKKEAAKGVIMFKPAQDTFLQKKARTMGLDDDFKQKLADKRRQK
jgi:hypothetical protein